MAYYSNTQAPVYESAKVPTFVTKVPHDVVLTNVDSRIFIKNIKTGVTYNQFKASMEKYGPVQIHMYEPGNKDNGWAWIGFENKESAMEAVKEAEREAAERKASAPANKGNASSTARNENDEKDEETHSFDAENEDSQLNDNEDAQEENEYKDDQDE